MSTTPHAVTPEEVLLEELTRSGAITTRKGPAKFFDFFRFRKTRAFSAQIALDQAIKNYKKAVANNAPEKTLEPLRQVRDARIRDFARDLDPPTWSGEDILIRELQAKGKIPSSPIDAAAIARLELLIASKEEEAHTAAIAIAHAQRNLEQATESEKRKKLRNDRDRALWENLPRLQLSALCFSGGGIRSASFSLGVAEALARDSYTPAADETPDKVEGILTDFDYLSTVSGGGYTGAFLTRWSTHIAGGVPRSFEQMVREIALPRYAGQFDDPEPPPIRNLRSYTSYLAPKGGLFSGDTWTLVATYLRNLILNWSILLPLLSLLALAPAANLRFGLGQQHSSGGLQSLYAIVVLVCISLLCACSSLPGMQQRLNLQDPTKKWLTRVHLIALCSAAVSLIVWTEGFLMEPATWGSLLQPAFVFAAVAPILVFAVARYWSTEQKRWSAVLGWAHFWRYLSGYAFASLASASIASALIFVLRFIYDQNDDRLFTTFAVPLATSAFVLIGWALNGFISRLESDDDREWWARSGAYLMMFAVAWAIVHGVVLYAGTILHQMAAVVGGIVGPMLGGLGFSRFTGSGRAKSGAQFDGKLKQVLARFALPIVAFFVLLSLIVLLAWGNEKLIDWLASPGVPAVRDYIEYVAILAVMLSLGNWYFNVNTFSMHGLYRNRLMRAFLGSARAQRTPDPFTQFDADDNSRMADAPAIPGAPLHIVNATLNLVGGKNLAWQERKAESFTFSPLHCGSSRVGYQRTLTYAGERGPTLATTMAISGAAASPNMGYHSSALMTMLMTFFNVRLGWWLPNPGKHGVGVHQYPSPRQALPALRDESTGHTNDSDKWVYLSDGGHFENLGLYEMVWRRCQKIVVIDGSADPQFTMEDLGNAFRKIYIDLGIPIEPDKSSAANIEAGMGESNQHCAVFSIKYDCVHKDVSNGTLVYIKSSLCSKLPDDVKQYAMQHAAFPHDPTFNQFFREAQFESYRRLGSHVIQHIMDRDNPHSGPPLKKSLDEFIQAARDYSSNAPHLPAPFMTFHEMTEFLESGKARFTIRTI
jgi:hypothetical protein